jgi:putative RecB family exonuclease
VAPVWEQLCAADPALAATLMADDGAETKAAHPDAAPRPDAAEARTARAAGAAAPWPAGVDALLDAYFALEDPRRLEPEARELLVEVELESGLLLRGYVDRVDRIGPVGSNGSTPRAPGPVDDCAAAAPQAPGHGAGAYRVVDYKTGTAPGLTTEARALFQMKFYALVLLLLRGRAPAELRLMYLTGPEALHYVPDEAQLLRFGRMLDAMWVAIRAAGATGDFRPNRGPACAWCCHRALCPAWDGVPPPYPGWPADTGPPSGADVGARPERSGAT